MKHMTEIHVSTQGSQSHKLLFLRWRQDRAVALRGIHDGKSVDGQAFVDKVDASVAGRVVLHLLGDSP